MVARNQSMSELSICFVGVEHTWLNPVCQQSLNTHLVLGQGHAESVRYVLHQ